MPVSTDVLGAKSKPIGRKLSCKKCTNGNKVKIAFPDQELAFHSQRLRDARCDDGAARNFDTAICQQGTETAQVHIVEIGNEGARLTINVTWNDGVTSKFPIE